MKPSLEDLSARARRSELSESEGKQLQLLLDASVEAGLAHRAGLEFDVEDSVLVGDDALAQRVTERLLDRQPISSKPSRRVWKLAAAGVFVVVAAAAGPPVAERASMFISEYTSVTEGPAVNPPARPAPAKRGVETSAPARAPERPAPRKDASDADRPATLDPLEPTEAKALRGSKKTATRSAGPQVEPEESGAATAFREASLLRRQGKTAEAIAGYGFLLQRYPNSAEARASEFALGMLHLKGGSPPAALSYFDRYLRANPGGQLAADALWGKTQALAAQGRREEARQGLRVLIDRYPRSTYATAARSKLGISPYP